MKVGVIGLGAMGVPMARNFAKAGYLAAVWNRSPSVAAELAEELVVRHAETPRHLAESADIIVTSVSADADVVEVIHSLIPGLSADQVVLDTSTVSDETAKQAARILSEKQVHFLDAPVSGGVEGAKNGTLAMMVGGDRVILDRVRPALDSVSQQVIHMGEVGTGQGTKAVNQIMAAGINQAVTEALAFAKARGLTMDKLIEVISAGAAGNWFLEHRGPSMTQGQYAPGFKLALHHKDLLICRDSARRLGIELPITDLTLEHYQQLMGNGFGDEDISALFRLKLIN